MTAYKDFGPHSKQFKNLSVRLTRGDREELASWAFRTHGPGTEEFQYVESYLPERCKPKLASWAFQTHGPDSSRFRFVEAQYSKDNISENASWAFHSCGPHSREFKYVETHLASEDWRRLAREAFRTPGSIDSVAFRYVEAHLTDGDKQILAPWAFTRGLGSAEFKYIATATRLSAATKRNIASQAFEHGLAADTEDFMYVEAYLETKEKRKLAERSFEILGPNSRGFKRVEPFLDKVTKGKLATWAFGCCGLDSAEFKYFERYLSREQKQVLAHQAFAMDGSDSKEFRHFVRDARSRQALLEQRILALPSSKEVNTWLEGSGEDSEVPSSATHDTLIEWLMHNGAKVNRNVMRALSSSRRLETEETEAQHIMRCSKAELQHLVMTQISYSLAPAVFVRLSDDLMDFEFKGDHELIPRDLFSCRSGYVDAALHFGETLCQQKSEEDKKGNGLSRRWKKLISYVFGPINASKPKGTIRLISPAHANDPSMPSDKDNFRFIASFISNHPDNVDWEPPFSLERIRQLADAWLIDELLTFEEEDLDFARRRQCNL